MRYTAWDPGLGRWVVQCLHKPNGEQITFYTFEEPAEVIENNKGVKMLYSSASVPKVFGEAIDRLAELENQKETDIKTIGEYEDRLRHLLKSKTIQLFDEYDPKTGTYKRDIRRLDTYGVAQKVLEFERKGRGSNVPEQKTVPPCPASVKKPEAELEHLRPCEADGKPAYFHKWIDESWVVQPSPMIGGHPGGTVRCTFALVEYADGTLRKVEPEDIKFTDRRGEE